MTSSKTNHRKEIVADSDVSTAIMNIDYREWLCGFATTVEEYDFDWHDKGKTCQFLGLDSRFWTQTVSASVKIYWSKYFWQVIDATSKPKMFTVICTAEVVTKTSSSPDLYLHEFGLYNQLWSFGTSTRDHDRLSAYFNSSVGPVQSGDGFNEWWFYTFMAVDQHVKRWNMEQEVKIANANYF